MDERREECTTNEPRAARDILHDKLDEQTRQEANSHKARRGSNRAAIILCSILAGVLALGIVADLTGFLSDEDDSAAIDAVSVRGDHISVLYIQGEITSDSDSEYSQRYVLDTIDGMMMNDDNQGMLLYVDTPGGGVYESDQVYLKVKEYQDETERPVYAYLASQATSGGYYVSANADKIIANRNCWTGSIGVTMGTYYNITGLLDKYGIKTETFDSGTNKSMGSITEDITDEQRQIFKSLIDDAYAQFVGIVAEGRDLDEEYVRSIADGRVYTAKQAESNKLVDEVVDTYEDALSEMQADCHLEHCDTYNFYYEPDEDLIESIVTGMDKVVDALEDRSDIGALTHLMEKQDEMSPKYLCKVIK